MVVVHPAGADRLGGLEANGWSPLWGPALITRLKDAAHSHTAGVERHHAGVDHMRMLKGSSFAHSLAHGASGTTPGLKVKCILESDTAQGVRSKVEELRDIFKVAIGSNNKGLSRPTADSLY